CMPVVQADSHSGCCNPAYCQYYTYDSTTACKPLLLHCPSAAALCFRSVWVWFCHNIGHATRNNIGSVCCKSPYDVLFEGSGSSYPPPPTRPFSSIEDWDGSCSTVCNKLNLPCVANQTKRMPLPYGVDQSEGNEFCQRPPPSRQVPGYACQMSLLTLTLFKVSTWQTVHI
ncbi:hypothetical protein JKP88DRAFT_255048, partial [Tribonema minus]